jgi:hypothetical protein
LGWREAPGGFAERGREEDPTIMTGPLEIALIVAALSIIVVPIVVGVFYLLTVQKALSRCSPQNRTLSPGLVWLMLIPAFGLIWHFFIVINVAKSLHAEFVMRNMVEEPSPGQGIGLAACILMVIVFIPYVGVLPFVAGFVCWIIYWMKISEYSNKIAQPYQAAQPPAPLATVA